MPHAPEQHVAQGEVVTVLHVLHCKGNGGVSAGGERGRAAVTHPLQPPRGTCGRAPACRSPPPPCCCPPPQRAPAPGNRPHKGHVPRLSQATTKLPYDHGACNASPTGTYGVPSHTTRRKRSRSGNRQHRKSPECHGLGHRRPPKK